MKAYYLKTIWQTFYFFQCLTPLAFDEVLLITHTGLLGPKLTSPPKILNFEISC